MPSQGPTYDTVIIPIHYPNNRQRQQDCNHCIHTAKCPLLTMQLSIQVMYPNSKMLSKTIHTIHSTQCCICCTLLYVYVAKTELLWCGSSRRTVQPPSDRVMICGSDIQPASVVRDLGVWINSGVTMSTHISKVVAGCFAILHQLRSIHWSLTQVTLTRRMVSLVLTRMDYCNSVLPGLLLSQQTTDSHQCCGSSHPLWTSTRPHYSTGHAASLVASPRED